MIAKDRRVPCVDLDNIMQKQHTDHTVHAHARRGIGAQNQRKERNVPGVLAGILVAAAIGEFGGAGNLLELVGLHQEGHLGSQARAHSCGFWASSSACAFLCKNARAALPAMRTRTSVR